MCCALILMALLVPALAVASYKKNAFSFLRYTYFFWALVSLYNFSLLAWLAIPPLLVFVPGIFKFSHFLAPPFMISLIIAAATTKVLSYIFSFNINESHDKFIISIMFNLLFLMVFLTSAEYYKNWLVEKALKNHNPECVQINSFLSSLAHGGQDFQFEAHALYSEKGKTYYWSYSKLQFFEGNERLDVNFPCTAHKTD